MKTTRIIHGVIAIFSIIAVPAAFAAEKTGQVGISLKGEELAKGKNITVDGDGKLIEASKLYKYEFAGVVRGKSGTPAAQFITKGSSISAFVESISPGASDLLKGTFSNPTGNLPVTVLQEEISGKRTVPGLGNVTFGMDIVGRITENGTCILEITNVRFKSTLQKNLGSIEFMAGSNLLISAAPVVTFLRANTVVSESAASVTVPVKRTTNQHGAVSVNYTTVPGTADSSDYTPTSGTLNFANLEATQNIVIPIIGNSDNDGSRRFTVELSDPSTGAFLGTTSTMVSIKDDD